MRSERRFAPRYALAAPVRFEGGTGVTLDLSAIGVCFETEAPFEVGRPLGLLVSIDRAVSGGQVDLRCRGQVCRVEPTLPQVSDVPRWRVAVALYSCGVEGVAS